MIQFKIKLQELKTNWLIMLNLKNNPDINVLSGLSKYLNLGFISSQKIASEVIKSNAP